MTVHTSYDDYPLDERRRADEHRLGPGFALLAIFGLSLLGWAVVLAPFVLVFRQ